MSNHLIVEYIDVSGRGVRSSEAVAFPIHWRKCIDARLGWAVPIRPHEHKPNIKPSISHDIRKFNRVTSVEFVGAFSGEGGGLFGERNLRTFFSSEYAYSDVKGWVLGGF